VGALISGLRPNTGVEPHTRFAERNLTPDELMNVSETWIAGAREKADAEIDQYMKDKYKVSLTQK
jgi:hypothetical protein